MRISDRAMKRLGVKSYGEPWVLFDFVNTEQVPTTPLGRIVKLFAPLLYFGGIFLALPFLLIIYITLTPYMFYRYIVYGDT